MSYKDIIYEKSGRAATITLNRPARLNAIHMPMTVEMREAFLDADADDAVRAIILTGAGHAFCAGADVATMRKPPADLQQQLAQIVVPGAREDYQGRFSFMLALRKPVIAAINGVCVGAGFTMALYSDIRIAARSARLGTVFIRRSLPGEQGTTWILQRLIGVSRMMDLLLTGRLIDAQEALQSGLLSRVVDDAEVLAQAREIAEGIADNCPPLAVAEAKRMAYANMFGGLADAIREDNAAIARLGRTQDFKEALKAFLEKRKPEFSGQ